MKFIWKRKLFTATSVRFHEQKKCHLVCCSLLPKSPNILQRQRRWKEAEVVILSRASWFKVTGKWWGWNHTSLEQHRETADGLESCLPVIYLAAFNDYSCVQLGVTNVYRRASQAEHIRASTMRKFLFSNYLHKQHLCCL